MVNMKNKQYTKAFDIVKSLNMLHEDHDEFAKNDKGKQKSQHNDKFSE